MKNQTIPKRWMDWTHSGQYPTANDRPLIGAKDRAHQVLRLLPLMIFRPNLVAITAIDTGIHLTGDECLKLTALLASNYAAIVDGLCGNIGAYAIPDALLVADKPGERAEVVAALNEMIAQEMKIYD